MQKMSARSRYMAFEALTRKHGVVCVPPNEVSVEDIVNSIGNIIGLEKNPCSFTNEQTNSLVVFVAELQLVHEIIVTGLSTENGRFVLASTLDIPAVKVLLSNVPPFIQNESVLTELSRFGTVVSEITMLPLGCCSEQATKRSI